MSSKKKTRVYRPVLVQTHLSKESFGDLLSVIEQEDITISAFVRRAVHKEIIMCGVDAMNDAANKTRRR